MPKVEDYNAEDLEFGDGASLSEIKQQEIMRRLDKMFRYALDHPAWTSGRERMIKCFKYREGEQWTAEELAVLAERKQPDTVNNQIAVVVNKLIGDLINQRFRIGYRGRNLPPPQPPVAPGQPPPPVPVGDDEIANVLTDIFLYVRQNNDLEFEERDMADDGFTGGMGVLEVTVEFDDMLQPEIKVKHEDPLIVFPDPDSRRYDWNEDARFVSRAKWVGIDEAEELYPHVADKLKSAVSSTSSGSFDSSASGQLGSVDSFTKADYVDKDNEKVRLIEVEYKKYYKEYIYIGVDGVIPFKKMSEVNDLVKAAKEQGLPYSIIDRLGYDICVGVYAAGVLCEHHVTDQKYYTLIPYFAYKRKSGEPYSLVALALSMQDAINKRESKALHLLSANRAIFERSAVKEVAKMAEERARPDGNIEVSDGALANGRFQLQENLELAASQYNMHKGALEDLYKIVGIDPRMGQQTGEIRSGAGLQRKYTEASKPLATLFDNIRRTRKIMARVILDRVQKYFTQEKIFLITDDNKDTRSLTLTAPIIERIKVGQYDVVVDEFEDNPTIQNEQFQTMAQTLATILPYGPFWTKMLLRMSDVRDKNEIIKQLEAQEGPPPLQPKLTVQANIDSLTPLERAFYYRLMGNEELAKQIEQLQPNTVAEQKGTFELAKAKIDADVELEKERIKASSSERNEDVRSLTKVATEKEKGKSDAKDDD